MEYKVSWIELVEHEVVVEADSREDAIDAAPYQEGKETGWREIEPDSFEVEEIE